MHSSNWMCVFLLTVHVFTHVLVDRTFDFKHMLCLNPVNLCTTMCHLVLTFILSGGATIIVRARHTRAIVNGRKNKHARLMEELIFLISGYNVKGSMGYKCPFGGSEFISFQNNGCGKCNFGATVFLIAKCLFVLVYPW